MGEQDADGHSAAFFTEARDYWWNQDFIRLVVDRLGLEGCRSMLDVGCGLGHWARAVGEALPQLDTLVGLDGERTWVEQANLGAADSGRGTAVLGAADALPFPDSIFDLSTCQTLLIHVADPAGVLREMRRVTRSGGTVLVAEPSNRASQVLRSSVSAGWPVEKLLGHLDFYLRCEQGKAKLGLGDNSIGDLLPGYLFEAGLVELEIFLSDRPSPLWPPYMSADQRALIADIDEHVAQGHWWGWSQDEARQYYVAGGGSPDAFEDIWIEHLADLRAEHDAAIAHTLTTAGGQLMYLAAGRVPG